jgi:hypothetical protein
MARIKIAPLILAMLIAAATGASRAARADDCLAGPNAQAPQGSHWFFHLDRATHRKCWYLGEAKRRRAPSGRASDARDAASPPEPAPAPVSAAPLQADASAPNPGFGTRWPDAASTPTAPAPAEVAAAVTAAAIPDRIAPRAVPTTAERAVIEPAKPQPAAKPAAAAPAAAADPQRGALPAALFGIALLLAAVGTMLVLAGRRLITSRRPYAAPHASEGRRARRRLQEILANAGRDEGVAGSPDEREARYPGTPHGPPGHFVPGVRRATRPPDIAAATLQPAIEELPPHALGSTSPGVEAAPDVERSLRELLAAWERRAA